MLCSFCLSKICVGNFIYMLCVAVAICIQVIKFVNKHMRGEKPTKKLIKNIFNIFMCCNSNGKETN